MKIKNYIRELEKGHLLSRLAILAVVVALLFTAGTFCLRTISTGLKLFVISDNINFITESANVSPNGWSDEAKENYNKAISNRNELINSDDDFISFVARSNNFVRFVTFISIATLVSYLSYLSFKLASCEIIVLKKYLKYKKRQKAIHHS